MFRQSVAAALLIFAVTASMLPTPLAHATNPPQINYLLVLNGHSRPQTYFNPGARLAFRVRLYLVTDSAIHKATARWRVTFGRRVVLNRSVRDHFGGPTRGNLFTQTQQMKLPAHATRGTYAVSVQLDVAGRRLSRSTRFWVKR